MKTEEIAEYLLHVTADKYVAVPHRWRESIYYSMLELSLHPEVHNNEYLAKWREQPKIHDNEYSAKLRTLSGRQTSNDLVINVFYTSRGVLSYTRSVKYLTDGIVLANQQHVVECHVAAIGKLLRDTVNFEELKRLCIEKRVFTEDSLNRELLKRTVGT